MSQHLLDVESSPWIPSVAGDHQGARDVLLWTAETFRNRWAIVTSFQAEGMVIIDLAISAGLVPRVLTIDTGRLPEETYSHIDRVRSHYGIDVEIVVPDRAEVAKLVAKRGPNLFLDSPEDRLRCCFVRKVLPFQRAVANLDAWITGLRREQGGARGDVSVIGDDRVNRPEGGLTKVSPLASWDEDAVWTYLRERGVPYHPLYDAGYRSVGCAPCTRPSRPGEGARAARWWWEGGSGECGLHQLDTRGSA